MNSVLATLAATAPLASAINIFGSPSAMQTCSGGLPASCQNNTAVEDSCCFVGAGSLVLTQFWDYDPSTGPADSWTIHGLWPDYCDGGYPETCDEDRQYSNITDILNAFDEGDTLSYMETYWKDYEGDDESFWTHEWGKHGTCVSTLNPECYSDYEPTEEAAEYFKTVVSLFKTLPTYKWLSAAGITPSESETYELSDIQSALSQKHGAEVYLDCEGDNLNQVWYYFNVQGPLQNNNFITAEPDGSQGSCPDSGVVYAPKSNSTSFHH